MKYFFTIMGALALLATMPAVALAQEISIQERTTMDFGKLAKPAAGSQYMQLSATSDTLFGTGLLLEGTPARGEYRVNHKKNFNQYPTFSLDVVPHSPHPSISFSNIQGLYDAILLNSFPAGGLPRQNGQHTLFLGMRVNYTSSVPTGTPFTPTIDLVVLFI